MNQSSDAVLVRAIRAGDPRAFDVLHRRYARLLERHARSLLGSRRTLAEDLVQETFERAYRALLRDERDVIVGAWLYTLLRNRCLDELRQTRATALELYDEVAEAPDADPWAILERRHKLAELVMGIAGLPSRQRAALIAMVIEGAAHETVAARLGTSVGATKSLVCRARENLTRPAAGSATRADVSR